MSADSGRVRGGENALSCAGLSKSYAGHRVLDSFSCKLAGGDVLALLGENGSGKSTFIKSLAGVVTPDADSSPVEIGGRRLSFGSPESSRALGCRFVHQDLGLVEDLSVLDNMLMVAGYPTRWGTIRKQQSLREVRADLERVGLRVDPAALVKTLSPATRTGVAVARALRPVAGNSARLLVLDEPTATLPDDEVERLLDVVRRTQQSGVGVVYVTHRLDEVFELGGHVTVLRDGRQVADGPVAATSMSELVSLMAGSELELELSEDATRRHASGPVRLETSRVRGATVEDVSLTVSAGEIVGVAGITGSGRESLLSLIFGGTPRAAGDVRVDGRSLPAGRPNRAVRDGLGYLPPDRKTQGGVLGLSVSENLTLVDLHQFSSPFRINRRRERAEVLGWTERLAVRPADAPERPLGSLSGGNQQKVLLGKWLRVKSPVLLVDEPTQGVDVGAKAMLHRQLVAAASEGLAVLVASTDLDELVALCDRVLIMRGGKVAREIPREHLSVGVLSQASLDSESELSA